MTGLGSAVTPSSRDLQAVPARQLRWLVAGAVLVVALAGCASAVSGPNTTPQAAAIPSATASPANTGPINLVGGNTATIEQFRGHPVMVWFVAGGCASCAASIPVVAQQLTTFAAAHTQILVLGLPADFESGSAGVTELRQFAQAAAGSALDDATWSWGMASLPLEHAYDPTGTADAYVLLNPSGKVAYANSAPVSTMGALLQHLAKIEVAP